MPESGPETLIERSAYLPQTPPRGWRDQAGGGLHARLRGRPLTDASLRPEVDKLVAAVGAARHLPFHGTVPARALGPDETRRATALAVGEGMDSAATRTEGEILKRLGLVGLIPAGRQGTGDLAAEAYAFAAPPAARYDAATGTLLVPNFLPLGAQRATLAHGIAHAVANQQFGLRRFLGLAPDRVRVSTATASARG